jgi:hypothetical protein
MSERGTPAIAAKVEPSARSLGGLTPLGTNKQEIVFIYTLVVADTTGLERRLE